MTSLHLKLQKELEAGKIANNYVLRGDEFWGKERFIEALRKTVVDPGMEDFNFDQLSASDIRGIQVADKAAMLPMMTDRRLIVITDCVKWGEKDINAISAYLKQPNESTILVLDAEGVDKRRKLFQHKKTTEYLEFLRPKPWELERYIQDIVRERGLKLVGDAVALVAEMVGDDIAKVHSELDKLALYKLGTNEITPDDVAALMGRTRAVTRYELNDFIGNRDLSGALMRINDITTSGETAIALLSSIGIYLRQLYQVKLVVSKGMNDRSQVGQMMGLPPNIAAKLISKQRSYSNAELRRALELLAQADYRLRSSRLSARLILDELICSILQPGPLSPPSFQKRRRV